MKDKHGAGQNVNLTGQARTIYGNALETHNTVPGLDQDKDAAENSNDAKVPLHSNHDTIECGQQKLPHQKEDFKKEEIEPIAAEKNENEKVPKTTSSRPPKNPKQHKSLKKGDTQSPATKADAFPKIGNNEKKQYRRPKRKTARNCANEEVALEMTDTDGFTSSSNGEASTTVQKVMPDLTSLMKDDIPDTSKDEELAKILSEEMNRGRRPKRRTGRTSELSNNTNNEARSSTEVKPPRTDLSNQSTQEAERTRNEGTALMSQNTNGIIESSQDAEFNTEQKVLGEGKNCVKDDMPDTSKDEELAKRLSEEMHRGRRQRRSGRTSKRIKNTGVEARSSTEGKPSRNDIVNQNAQKVDKTENGGSTTAIMNTTGIQASPNRVKPTADEKAMPEGSDVAKENMPDTSKDEELAKRLSEEMNRGKGRRRPDQSSTQTDYSFREAPETTMNETKNEEKKEECPMTSDDADGAVLHEEKPENSKDEEFARQLAAEIAAEAALNNASEQTQKLDVKAAPVADEKENERGEGENNDITQNEEVTDYSIDKEIASQLAAEVAVEAKVTTKQNVQQERAGTSTITTKGKELSTDKNDNEEKNEPCFSKENSKTEEGKIDHAEENKESNTVEDDEAFAKKLEQELRDEEFARQLNEKETKRLRRASYLAKKKTSERKRNKEAETSKEEESSTLESAQPEQSENKSQSETKTAYNEKEGRLQPSTQISPSNNEANSEENVSNSQRSRDASPKPGQERNFRQERSVSPKPSGRRSVSPKPSGRRSVSPKPSGSRSVSPKPSGHRSVSPKPGGSRPTSPKPLSPTNLDQEKKDEELARALASAPQRISVYHIPEPENARAKKKCDGKRVLAFLIPAIVIVAAIVGLVVYFNGGGASSIAYGGPYIKPEEEEDLFAGLGATRWNIIGSGLHLDVHNALSDDWQSMFGIAIEEWQSGTPDALRLKVVKTAYDPECKERIGVLKVCNADYGETKWRGLNQVILRDNFIISSVARLNEYYLRNANDAQRQYTMCHEIGHGFGLPHTDEDFNNEDLGNCMDYTTNPEANKSPSTLNFYDLFEMYGEVRRSMVRSSYLKSMPSWEIAPELSSRISRARETYEKEIHDSVSGEFLHSSFLGKTETEKLDLGGGYQLIIN
eukprot:CAMPEP_0178932568 /NCGR_PEP_ID=MMETSP0786-20121207/22705_1 /TAXON_ID=186022 /ORGANISM="Thalassionema frauenfeldii, Strain CCMP 1798" /LENGTH=1138 /DNA_ID=CAMNT_0020609905 /DNA_START=314 /DNA_END=3727 /DNA_ORIENTATION=+